MRNSYNNPIKLGKRSSLPNPSFVFPFKKNPIFDFSEKQKIQTIQQDIGYNDFSSSDDKNEESLNLEETLSNFYEYALDCYKKNNMYETLIKEIELNEHLYYIGSRESFDILILKIKCLMKLMIEEYDSNINSANDTQILIKEYILKIQNEFYNIEIIINRDDFYQYEIITQTFCKFLIYLIKFTQKKEEYCKSLAYITLGINMLKIFFIKKQMTTNIKTYKKYIYLLLLLINQLIGERNFKQALFYSDHLLKVIEKTIKIIYEIKSNDKKKKNNNNDKSIVELFRCIGFTYLYIGFCFENLKNSENAMEAYKQSFYFFMKIKSSLFIINKKNKDKYIYDNNFIKISHLLLNEQKLKIEEDKNLRDEFSTNDELSKKKEQKKELDEKRKKLKLISTGLYGDIKKFEQIEKKIYNNFLTAKNQKLITKLDKNLLSLAYSENNTHKKKGLKKTLSLTTMDNLCHYQMYNKLMSNKYHDFIMTNNNLKLSYPKDQEEFISKINSYLTSTMEIKPQNDKTNRKLSLFREDTKKNSFSSGNIFNTNINTKTKISSARTPRSPQLTNYHIFESSKKNAGYNKNKNNKKQIIKKNNSFASLKIDIPKTTINTIQSKTINKSLSETCITSKTANMPNSRSKYRTKSKNRISSYTDFGIIKNLKKNTTKKHYLSPKYFNKYMYLDKLIKKELDFQKIILGLKSNNSKLYYKRFYKELFVELKNKEEETNQNYLLINEKINQKVLKNQKEYEKMINNNIIKRQESKHYKYLLKINKGKNLFNSHKTTNGSNLEYDFFDSYKKTNMDYNSDDEEIKKNNEKSLFSLNEKIKNIRNKINERKEKLKYH